MDDELHLVLFEWGKAWFIGTEYDGALRVFRYCYSRPEWARIVATNLLDRAPAGYAALVARNFFKEPFEWNYKKCPVSKVFVGSGHVWELIQLE